MVSSRKACGNVLINRASEGVCNLAALAEKFICCKVFIITLTGVEVTALHRIMLGITTLFTLSRKYDTWSL